ncbi:hypothetical protein, partial [Helicobacter sp. 13S00477-4]|uniref:hypothetical protein n=1 Tax=Helicobacter sp. 13S00477-4 TaxID=1905759 RepID=UPI000BA6BEC8
KLKKDFEMTLIIENLDDKFVPAFKSLANVLNAKVKDTQALEWKKEADKMIKDYKNGKLKAYETIEELKAELEDDI